MDTIDVEILATVVNNGTGDFDQLTNRPKYNGVTMSHETNIPEVKTETWDGKYTKPATGIPKTDMASDVQTSLGKADTAIQEHQSLAAYRTSAAQDVIDTALSDSIEEKYEKPDAGIPKTDLTEAVQTSLGKADSALQEHQSLSAYRTASAQDAIDITKASALDLTAHTGNTSNPHSVTAEQTAYDSAATSHTSGSVAAQLAAQSEQIVTLGSTKASLTELGKSNRRIHILENLTKGKVWDEETGTSPIYQHDVETGMMGAEFNKIGGKTVKYNQLVQNGNFTSSDNWSSSGSSFTVENNMAIVLLSEVSTASLYQSVPHIIGHKYYMSAEAKSSDITKLNFYWGGSYVGMVKQISSSWTKIDEIHTSNGGSTNFSIRKRSESVSIAGTVYERNFQIFDLTAIFGSGSEPATAEDANTALANIGIDVDIYNPYSAGSLVSANVQSVDIVDEDNVQIAQLPIPQALRTAHPLRSAGTVHDEYDLERMKFVKRVGTVNLGTLNWTYNVANLYFISNSPSDSGNLEPLGKSTVICSPYSTLVGNVSSFYASDKTILFNSGGLSGSKKTAIKDSAYSDAAAFKTAMAGVVLYYELATPEEVDINSYFPNGNVYETEPGGTVTYTQSNTIDGSSPAVAIDARIPIPNETIFMTNEIEAVS